MGQAMAELSPEECAGYWWSASHRIYSLCDIMTTMRLLLRALKKMFATAFWLGGLWGGCCTVVGLALLLLSLFLLLLSWIISLATGSDWGYRIFFGW